MPIDPGTPGGAVLALLPEVILTAWALVVLSVGVFVHARVTGLRQLTASYAAAGLPLAVAQRCAARTLVGALPK